MPKPLFTIVMPAYNHELYVAQAIQSVLNQKYQTIQFIVIDDGSTDRTPEIINKILKQNPGKFKFIRQKNQGIGRTLNTGLKLARGKYFYYLASDDLLVPETIATIVEYFEKLPANIAFIHSQVWHKEKEIKKPKTDFKDLIYENYIWKNILLNEVVSILGPACFFRTKCLKAVHGFTNDLPLEDFHLLLKLAFHYPSCYLPKKIVLHRHHQTNNAHNYKIIGPAALKTIELFFKEYHLRDRRLKRQAIALRYRWQFWVGFKNRDRSWAIKYFWKYFCLKPTIIFDLNSLKALTRSLLHVYK